MDKTRKFFVTLFVFFVFVSLAAIVSWNGYKKNVTGVQKTFVFPSVEEGRLVIERRTIRLPYGEVVEQYVNELLLGPQTERTERLLPKDTKVLSCFQRSGTLYLDLSNEAIFGGGKTLSLEDSFALLKENILNNFNSISEVEVYVEGNLAFDFPKGTESFE